MNELISVIVPIYNIKKCVAKCVESLLRQTYQNLEIILVDDGSTDGSGTICDEYAAKDGRIRVLHKQNEGLSDARNSGMEICCGRYIGFVDGDDWLADDMYEFLYKTLAEHDADVAVCGHYIEDDEGVYDTECADGELKVYDSHEAVCAVVHDVEIHSYAWGKLYKKELFDGIKYPSHRYEEDIFTTYRVFMNARKIVCNNRPQYHYYQRKGSIMTTRGNKLNWDQFSAYQEWVFVLGKDYPELREFLVMKLVGFGIAAYNSLLLAEEWTEQDALHAQEMLETIKIYRDEIKKYGNGKSSFRINLVGRKWYPRIYRNLKKLTLMFR